MQEKALEKNTASALRNLLIQEVKKFIVCLDHSPTEELQEMKHYLTNILNLITEKEREEITPIPWGKNSTPIAKNHTQSDSLNGITPDL